MRFFRGKRVWSRDVICATMACVVFYACDSVCAQVTAQIPRSSANSDTESGFLLTTDPAVFSQGAEFPNPYYSKRRWKLWSQDDSPVEVDGKQVQGIDQAKRLFPPAAIPTLAPFTTKAFASGHWDDVYLNQDNGHSNLREDWADGSGLLIPIAGQAISSRKGQIVQLGANFTSQSTSGMGHDVTNNGATVRFVEQQYYFANALRMGPAHTSFYEYASDRTKDEYYAHFPTMYNSVGSSGSETWAISKMMIAGAYLDRKLKDKIKEHGLYPATLLYLWKAGLPFRVPYEHELRHRLAYYSKGDHTDYKGIFQTEYNHWYHAYDERQHLENMVRLAADLKHVPPVPVLDVKGINGGDAVYGYKTCILAKQNASDVSLLVSMNNSYDIDERPISFKWMLLEGSKKTTVATTTESGVYVVTVPLDAILPKGRTTILVFADNGSSSSNPVAINIFRTLGKENRRPSLPKLADRIVLPGESVEFKVAAEDPDFTDTNVYLMSGVGDLTNGVFRWKCPIDAKEGSRPVVLIASDGCGGFASERVVFKVQPNRPVIDSLAIAGQSIGKVRLDSAKSTAAGNATITRRQWALPDKSRPRSTSVMFDFGSPGIHKVKLAIESKWGVAVTSDNVEVKHDWPLKIDRGWTKIGLSPSVWETTESNGQIKIQSGKVPYPLLIKKSGERFELASKPLKPPIYLECDFSRRREKGSGVSLFGVHIGHPVQLKEGDPFAGDTSITLPGPEPKQVFIGRHTRSSNHPSTLRLYVTKSSEPAGKLRFSGVLQADLGDYPFIVDNVSPTNNVFKVHCAGTFYLRNFKVWSPN